MSQEQAQQTQSSQEEQKKEEKSFQNICKEKASELSKRLGISVTYETITDGDKQYVAYFKEPNIMASVKALDMFADRRTFEAGQILWQPCFLREESSPEIEKTKKYQIGLFPRLAALLEAHAPDIKKN